MEFFGGKYRVKSTRLPGRNYRAPGIYFITICTQDRIHWFGDIDRGKMILNDVGRVVAHEWKRASIVRKYVELDEWVIMPNHVHGIIVLKPSVCSDDPVINAVETHREYVETPCHGVSTAIRDVSTIRHNIYSKINPHHRPEWQSGCLGAIVGRFKRQCTVRIRELGYTDFTWQSRFHDIIIRNEKSLHTIRQYIQNNPITWHRDRNNIPALPG